MKRGAGVLLPIFSLPSEYGIGTFGREAYKFAGYLKKCGVCYWQILPLNPTSYGDSPYQSFSAFALNPYFIDLDVLIDKGYINSKDVAPLRREKGHGIDYGKQYNERFKILYKAFVKAYEKEKPMINKYHEENASWIDDYALFMVMKKLNGGKSFLDWDKSLTPLKSLEKDCEGFTFWIYLQYEAYKQYRALKDYVNSLGIKIIGDIPIYVALDSAECCFHSELFQLNSDKRPLKVAGVPPDCFTADGQLWGNPLYDWQGNRQGCLDWWGRRVERCRQLYDVMRLDHFRGIESYWAVPAGEKTARNGMWVEGPKGSLVDEIKSKAGNMDVIAEDLGYSTPEVIALKEYSGWPGMVIYEFGFDPNDKDGTNGYLPQNYKPNCVAYFGTHDNETLWGYLKTNKDMRKVMFKRLGVKNMDAAYSKMFVNMIDSKADTVVFQMQDLLKEDDSCRINCPGTLNGNWQYRLKKDYANPYLAKKLKKLLQKGHRSLD